MIMTAYKYVATFVDTETDDVTATKYSDTLIGLKRVIRRHIHPEKVYTGRDWEIVYIMERSFNTPEGRERLSQIAKEEYIDPELLATRGLDFDVWHDLYLTDGERDHFDTVNPH